MVPAAATADDHRECDQADRDQHPQQRQDVIKARECHQQPTRTPEDQARLHADLFPGWHLLARGQTGECGQQSGQPGVRAGEPVLYAVQDLLLSRAEAHHGHLHRLAVTSSPRAAMPSSNGSYTAFFALKFMSCHDMQ
jgi:hypothetical protein